MPRRRFHPLLIPLPAALCLGVALAFSPIKKTPSNDMDAFVQSLPAPGANDRVFLAIDPALETSLAIDPGVVRSIDPGIACNPSENTATATLGRAGSVQVICMQAGRSQAVMTLHDGSTFVTICGNPILVSRSLIVGDRAMHFSTQSSVRELTHSCSGWTKLPS